MFLWTIPSPTLALDPTKAITQHKLDIWQVERGLPHNSIYAITQDRQGYLWLGTKDGLVRFDGVRFTVFNKENSPLQSNNIRALLVDDGGNLWIGTKEGGLTYLDNRGRFITYGIDRHPELNEIRALCKARDGSLWIATYKHGASRLKDNAFTTYEEKDGLGSNRVKAIFEDDQGNLLFVTSVGVSIRTPDGSIKDFLPLHGIDAKFVYSVLQRKNGEIWIGAFKAVYRIRGSQCMVYHTGKGFPFLKPLRLYEDSEQVLWIGTDGNGLAQFKEGAFKIFKKEDGLADEFVYSIFEDHEGSLWIGTTGGGLHRFRDTTFTNYSSREGLLNDAVNAVCEDSAGNLWVGTNWGLNSLDKERNVKLALTKKNGLQDNLIHCIMEQKNGSMWVGTNNGLHRLRDSKIDSFTTRNGLSNNRVLCIYQDRNRNIWIGTRDGLNRFDNGTFVSYKNEEGLHNFIYCILEDRNNTMWFGTHKGLYYLSRNQLIKAAEIKFADLIISALYEDQDGVFFLGTLNNGIFRWENNRSFNITVQNGLVENQILILIDDEKGNLWLAGKSGISSIKKEELKDLSKGLISKVQPTVYTEKDGLKSRKFNSGGIKSQDGKLWFASYKGLEVIDPANIKKNSLPPPVILEGLNVDGMDIIITPPRQKNLKTSQATIQLPPGRKRFKFQYTALSFLRPEKTRFNIKLKGYDNDWISMGNTRSIIYTGLPPKQYSFEVSACNSDGVWNRQGTSLTFYVRPFFYQTKWFLVSAVLFLLLALFTGYRIRVRHLMAREKKLSKLVDERTRALKERTDQLETAHESLKKSKQVIEEKNRNIMSSLHYAEHIQQSLLPAAEKIKDAFHQHFIVFRPRDIVSGDFYWFSRKENIDLVAVVDCTGHGVPGALLSMVGELKLNEIVNDKNMTDPAAILTALNAGVKHSLNQESDKPSSNESMDTALCAIDRAGGKVTFAGARRPLFYIAPSGLKIIKGVRNSIGGRRRKSNPPAFENHVITFDSKISLYLFSDGLADQHNRENQKYGTRGIKEFLEDHGHLDFEMQKRALQAQLDSFQGGGEQRDDITFIGIHVKKSSQ